MLETEDGEEVSVERLRDAEKGERPQRTTEQGLVDRRGRPVQKPTLQRVFRRAAIFAPVLLLFVYLTSGDRLTPAGIVLNAVILVAFFIPFSYLVDTMVYRMVVRRHERERAAKRAG